MTENQIERQGFDFIKSYTHDKWWTRRFQKGLIQIEFTYKNETTTLETVSITIDEVVGKEFSFDQLKQLDNILNK